MSVESYGLKISLPGYDVNSATPEQCSVDSHYDSFKIALDTGDPLEGNIIVTLNQVLPAGTYPVLTITTPYNYIPAFYMFFDIRGSSGPLSNDVGIFFSLDESEDVYFQAIVQPNEIQFNFVTDGADDVAMIPGSVYAFRYYVFAEDAI